MPGGFDPNTYNEEVDKPSILELANPGYRPGGTTPGGGFQPGSAYGQWGQSPVPGSTTIPPFRRMGWLGGSGSIGGRTASPMGAVPPRQTAAPLGGGGGMFGQAPQTTSQRWGGSSWGGGGVPWLQNRGGSYGGGIQPQGGAGGAASLPGDNPFGYDPTGARGNYSYTQLGQQFLNAMIQSGLLNPLGSSAMTGMLRDRAISDANSLRARSNTVAQLAGLDPAQFASQMVQNDMGMNGSVLDSLMNANLQSAMMNQDFLRGIVGQGFGYNYQPKA